MIVITVKRVVSRMNMWLDHSQCETRVWQSSHQRHYRCSYLWCHPVDHQSLPSTLTVKDLHLSSLTTFITTINVGFGDSTAIWLVLLDIQLERTCSALPGLDYHHGRTRPKPRTILLDCRNVSRSCWVVFKHSRWHMPCSLDPKLIWPRTWWCWSSALIHLRAK